MRSSTLNCPLSDLYRFLPGVDTVAKMVKALYLTSVVPSVLKIGEYPRIFPSFSRGIFAHVTRLDQSRASENI